MKTKILSAKQFRKKHTTTAFINSNEEAEKCMIEFAKLHVKAALEKASKEVICEYTTLSNDMGHSYCVNTNSIINAYPETLIK